KAAAEKWHVHEEQCDTLPSKVRHVPTGRTLSYGALASRAGAIGAKEQAKEQAAMAAAMARFGRGGQAGPAGPGRAGPPGAARGARPGARRAGPPGGGAGGPPGGGMFAAAAMPHYKLKDPKDFRIIGKAISGVDNPSIVTGKPLFGIDQSVPGMKYAVYERCPVFGGRAVSANLAEIKALPGIHDAFIVEGANPWVPDGMQITLVSGVAIIGDTWWAANKALDKLAVQWDEGPGATQSTEKWHRTAADLAGKPPGKVFRKDGDFDKAVSGAAKVIEGSYQ